MRSLLVNYVNYNLWANKRIAEVLSTFPNQVLDQEVKSSFPSLRKTVHHIWDAELTWKARLSGEVLSWPPTARYKDPAITAFTGASEEFVNFVSNKEDVFFVSQCTYSNSKGTQFTNPVCDIIMHCVNHSTFHRGQIITMLHELGHNVNLPATDLIAYVRK